MSFRSLNDDLRVTIGIVASQSSLTLVFYYRRSTSHLGPKGCVECWQACKYLGG